MSEYKKRHHMVVYFRSFVHSRRGVGIRFSPRLSLLLILFSSIFSFITFSSSFSQEIDAKQIGSRISSYFEKVMDKFDIPGVAVAVTKGEKIIFADAYGVRDLDTGESLKPEYLFHMASVSKPFVATAIMQLVEKGLMKLDEHVITYLPYFELADDRYREITIRQMLNHTSGMPDVIDYEWDKPQYDTGAAERYVRSLKKEKMIAGPGERWRYSNMAFDALGDVIAKVSGLPFEIYVKENILDPLGMTESNFLRKETSAELRTTPHVWKLKPVVSAVYPYNRRHAPSSTLNSSVIEMGNWIMANLNKGELNGNRILDAKGYDLLWSPSVSVNSQIQVGLSWFLGHYRGHSIIYHSGGDTGYRSYCTLIPDLDIGLILASNYNDTPMNAVHNAVLDILLGHEARIPKQSVAFAFAEVYLKDGLDAAKQCYQKLYRQAKDKYVFGDRELNRLGYYFLSDNRVQQAIEIFETNVDLYPKIANTYYSLGEAYMTAGQTEKALVSYQKALKLDPGNRNAAEMIKKLKENNLTPVKFKM